MLNQIMKKTLLTSYSSLIVALVLFFGTPMISEAQSFCNSCIGQQDFGWNNNGWNNGWNNNGWNNNNNWGNGIMQSSESGSQSIFTNGGVMQSMW